MMLDCVDNERISAWVGECQRDDITIGSLDKYRTKCLEYKKRGDNENRRNITAKTASV